MTILTILSYELNCYKRWLFSYQIKTFSRWFIEKTSNTCFCSLQFQFYLHQSFRIKFKITLGPKNMTCNRQNYELRPKSSTIDIILSLLLFLWLWSTLQTLKELFIWPKSQTSKHKYLHTLFVLHLLNMKRIWIQ